MEEVQEYYTEEIVADPQKQSLSNAEAALLLHDSYEKKMDILEKKRKQLHLNEWVKKNIHEVHQIHPTLPWIGFFW